MTEEVQSSFRIVWITLSLMVLAILAAPFTLGRDRIARIVPVCEWKAKYGRECAFCGMTTSFLAISEGRVREASRANRAGIPLYLLFVTNELCLVAWACKRGMG